MSIGNYQIAVVTTVCMRIQGVSINTVAPSINTVAPST